MSRTLAIVPGIPGFPQSLIPQPESDRRENHQESNKNDKQDRLDATPQESVPQESVLEKTPITLYRGSIGKLRDDKPGDLFYEEGNLLKLIDQSEKNIRQLVAEIQLNGVTPPPAPGADEVNEETPGVAQTIEKLRENLRRLKELKTKLTDAHTQRLNEISADVALVVNSTEKKIRGVVAEVNQFLADYDDGKGPVVTITAARTALETGLKNIEGYVKELHEKQEALAERVKELGREPAEIADELKLDRESPDSKSAGKKDEKKTSGDETGDSETTTGGGGKKFTDHLPLPGKEDAASNEKDDEGAEREDPNADAKEQIAEIEERLQEQSQGAAQQNTQQQRPSPLDKLTSLLPFVMVGMTGLGQVAGMAGPALAAAAQREQFERDERDEDDEDDEDDAQERRNVASADASPSNGETPPPPPPPGVDPKVANLGDKQVPTGSPAEARALEAANRGEDHDLPEDAKNSQPMDPAQLNNGQTGVAVWERGLERVVGTEDGPQVVSKDKLAAFDPHNPPADYGNFLGLRDPDRLDQVPAQVAAAPPPGQTALV